MTDGLFEMDKMTQQWPFSTQNGRPVVSFQAWVFAIFFFFVGPLLVIDLPPNFTFLVAEIFQEDSSAPPLWK